MLLPPQGLLLSDLSKKEGMLAVAGESDSWSFSSSWFLVLKIFSSASQTACMWGLLFLLSFAQSCKEEVRYM